MRIAITGASGFIGSALVPALRADGHQVLRLVRRAAHAQDEVAWDPGTGWVDRARLAGVDAGIHLAGAGLAAHRWTAEYKRTIRDSRVDGTTAFSRALASLEPLPRVLVSSSGVGWYGDTGDVPVSEGAPPADDFLAQVCVEWEASTAAAEAAGIRVCHLRTGIVLSRRGGALARMLPIFRLGVGGRLGSGRQYWSFISLADQIGAIRHLLADEQVRGAVNATAPFPVRNAEFTKALGRAVRRPAVLPVPALALRIYLGEMASDVLGSQRVLPTVLPGTGYSFEHPDVDTALAWAVRH